MARIATMELVTICAPLWMEAPPVKLDASDGDWYSTIASRHITARYNSHKWF